MKTLIGINKDNKYAEQVAKIMLQDIRIEGELNLVTFFSKRIAEIVLSISSGRAGKLNIIKPLDKSVVLTHRILRQLVHEFANDYNLLHHKNLVNPYSISLSNWENHKFMESDTNFLDILKKICYNIISTLNNTLICELVLNSNKLYKNGNYVITNLREPDINLLKKYNESGNIKFYLIEEDNLIDENKLNEQCKKILKTIINKE